ncbi:MAG: AMP-binding protein [Prevotellaceae bacterium]|jgi:long-chain acyl-CoA synthetase|nr:AMP-binding protein [Prevotellaceae bacterium]
MQEDQKDFVLKPSLMQAFETTLKRNWDLPALSNYDGSTFHYKDIARRIAKLHILFEECGLKKGDRVSLCGRNSAEWGTVFLAVATYGAVTVPILHEFKPDNVHNVVEHSESRILFVGDVVWENLNEKMMPNVEAIILINDFSVLYSKDKKVQKVRDRLNELFGKKYPKNFRPEHVAFFKENPKDLMLINYTSGTTGFSKGVMLSYGSVYNNMLFAWTVLKELKAGDSIVAMLPMAHMYGMAFEFLYEITRGCHVQFLTRAPTPKIIMEAFQKVKPRLIVAVPLIIEKIYKTKILPKLENPLMKAALNLPVVDKAILGTINKKLDETFGGNFCELIIGGAALNQEVEKFFKKMGFRYTVGYGMTECGPIISYEDWRAARLYSCGRSTLNMEIRIDSSDPEHIVGEVQVRGANVLLGYYKNPEATAAMFTSDGWMKTGDLGTIDKDGYLFLRGRCKNMILGPSGQNIYPEELEDKINNTPFVTESIVIDDGGKLVALIYPDFGAVEQAKKTAEAAMEEMRNEVNALLPSYSQITRVDIFPEEFEKTPKRSIKRFMYQKK